MKAAFSVACVALVLASIAPVRAQDAAPVRAQDAAPVRAQDAAPRTKWWHEPATQAALHLTHDQVAKIDTLFEATLPQRQALLRQLNELESAEDTLLSQATLDDHAAMRVIDQVEAVRAQRNASRAMLLYRIRQVLTPDQRRWFDARRTANRPAGTAGASGR